MLRHLFRSRKSRPAKPRPTFRPTLEGVEERVVPAGLGSITPSNLGLALLADPALAAQVQALANQQINALQQLLATATTDTLNNLNQQILALDQFTAGLGPITKAAVAPQVAQAEISLVDRAVLQLNAVRDFVAGQEAAVVTFLSQFGPFLSTTLGTGTGSGQTSGGLATGTYVGVASPNGNFSSSTANIQNVNQTVTVNITSVNNGTAAGSVMVSPFTGTRQFNGNYNVPIINGALSSVGSNGVQFIGLTANGNSLQGGLSVTDGFGNSVTFKNLTLNKQ